MNHNLVLVMAIYKPKSSAGGQLETLIKQHYPTLREFELATTREPFIGRSSDGSYIEIFEWVSEAAAKRAHDHPAVAKIWEAMAKVCDFGALNQLPESQKVFPQFQSAF